MNHTSTSLRILSKISFLICLLSCIGAESVQAESALPQQTSQFLHCSPASPEPLVLASGSDRLSVFDGHAEILFDTNRTLSPEQVMTRSSGWRRMESETEIQFFTGYTYWIRFRLRATPEAVRALHREAMLAVIFSYARHFDCYLPQDSSAAPPYVIQYSGLDVPADDRPVWWSGNTFRIPLDTTPRVIYLRCEGIVAVMTQGYVLGEVPLLNVISWLRAFSLTAVGILLAFFLYNIFLYFIVRDRVYLYYLGYVAFFGGFFMFFESGFITEIPGLSAFTAHNNPVAFLPALHLGLMFVLLFTDILLTLPLVAPRWSKVLRVLAIFNIVLMFVEWSFSGANRYRTYPILYPLANLNFFISVCCAIIAAILALRKGVVTARYYLGGWATTVFAATMFNLSVFNVNFFSAFLGNIAYRIGITLEMIIFSVALAERIRVLQREKSQAGERERERIYRDLHDGLGAQIVEIAAMSEQLREEVRTLQEDRNIPEEGVEWATAIANNVHALRSSLRETIWVLNAENDSLEALTAYLRTETSRMLETGRIEARYDIPFEIPARTVPPETRRNTVMVVREACSNILKHARASTVQITMIPTRTQLRLVLHDNGRGFAPSAVPRFSNGLRTMQRRMDLVNGTVSVDSEEGKGTKVEFVIPL